jgi:hypothetical protein
LWLVGGLALMLWFRRRSAAPIRSIEPVKRPNQGAALRTSGTRPAAARPQVAAPPADAFAELQSLLDASDQSPPRAS